MERNCDSIVMRVQKLDAEQKKRFYAYLCLLEEQDKQSQEAHPNPETEKK